MPGQSQAQGLMNPKAEHPSGAPLFFLVGPITVIEVVINYISMVLEET